MASSMEELNCRQHQHASVQNPTESLFLLEPTAGLLTALLGLKWYEITHHPINPF